MRLRGRGDEDVKEREDGNGNSGRRGTPPGGDKASSMPLSKDMDERIDSMDEKNPDIIPQNSGESVLSFSDTMHNICNHHQSFKNAVIWMILVPSKQEFIICIKRSENKGRQGKFKFSFK
jgi:hypothetical protein